MGCVTAGTYTPGVERYEFKGLANIGPTSGIPASCCNVRFSISISARNSNNVGSGGSNFYTDAIVNRCLSVSPCNSSPEFKNDPFVTTCGNEAFIYNPGAFDKDDDSLTFSFAPALTDFNTPANYFAPFSYDKPMPWLGNSANEFPQGIHCDPVNGDIMFIPSNSGVLFTGVVVEEVKQWKKFNGVYQVIGTTRRDVNIYVRGDCTPNNTPLFRTIPYDSNKLIPKTQWETCAGSRLCFTITAKDTDVFPSAKNDTTTLSWDAALASYGATFLPTYNAANRAVTGPAEDSYEFCWTPAANMARNAPYIFTIGGTDNRCPNPARIRRAFTVKVNKQPDISITKTNKQCGRWKIGYSKNDSTQALTGAVIQIGKQPFDYQFNAGSYTYTNFASIPDIYFKQPGKYLIKASAQMGNCNTTIYDTITIDTILVVSTKDTTVCPGSPVTLTATVSNVKGTVQYKWFNSISDTTATPLNTVFSQPGLSVTAAYKWYTIQAKDQSGCAAYDSALVSAVNISQATVSDQSCWGTTNGSIVLSVTGGTKPYRFSKDSILFDTSASFTNLQPGNYKIHVIDSNKCYTSITKTIAAVDSIRYTTTVKHILCNGSTVKGEIKISAAGGKKPYTFQLGNAAFVTDSVFKNLDGGTYTISIKDANGCIKMLSEKINNPPALQQTNITTHVTCKGSSSGSILVTAIGGTPPYLYRKASTEAYDTITLFKNLASKTYSMGIIDANNCTLNFSVNVNQPLVSLNNTSVVVKNQSCYEKHDGQITVTATGGTPPYQYALDSTLFSTTKSWTNLGEGIHTITTKDSVLCSVTSQITITRPAKVTGSTTTKASTCSDRADGSITITPVTGKSPFTYNLNSGSYSTSTVFKNLVAGSYLVGIRDSSGCKDSMNIMVSGPAPIVAGNISGPTHVYLNTVDSFSVPAQTGVNFFWSAANGTIVNGQTSNNMHVRWDSLGMGSVTVAVYSDTTCGDTSSMNVSIGNVGLSELAGKWGLRVYPNPAKQSLTITLQQLPEQQTLQLYDMQGKLLLQQDLKHQQQLNIETLSPGIYMLKIGNWSGQVIKE